MKINYKIIINFVGILLIFNGACMALSSLVSLYYGESVYALLLSGVTSVIIGASCWLLMKNAPRGLKKKEGYLIVTLVWVFISLSGMMPYLISGAIPDLSSAIFESMSGYTTTGATILEDIESLEKGILFWRSLTHWIGGMGIIVLTIAILPILGIGGMELFIAESPGPTADKLHPRITQTAKRLWFIYLGLTLSEVFLFKVAGMGWFDAVNHAMSASATGGFSTRNASLAYFQSPLIEYMTCLFMFIGGANFTLIYFGFKGRFDKLYRNEEFRTYMVVVMFFVLIVALSIFFLQDTAIEEAFRFSLFQVLAVITTTGFVTSDFTSWSSAITIIFFVLMFLGASAGSTSGGVKIVRHLIIIKNSFLEFKRLLHPSAIIPVRLNKRVIVPKITFNVLAFFLLYILIFMIGTVVMATSGENFITSLGSVAATLGNVGPGIGDVGPMSNYAEISNLGKWFLSLLMLLGRLELFTILILFTPYFWKIN
jgi:trk system potassium uptake protein TrkH